MTTMIDAKPTTHKIELKRWPALSGLMEEELAGHRAELSDLRSQLADAKGQIHDLTIGRGSTGSRAGRREGRL